METPEWLNEELLATALQGCHDGNISITSFSVKPAVPPGNNYLSDIYRVRVEYKTEGAGSLSRSLIVKSPMHVGPPKDDDPEDEDFFAKESKVYCELLPKLQEEINYQFGPESYPCSVKNGLVLQDMIEEGYKMCSRFEQLDYEHCRRVLETLAKFHAASVACLRDHPNIEQTLGGGPPMNDDDSYVAQMKSQVEIGARKVAEITKDIENCQDFSEFIMTRVDHLWSNFKELFSLHKGKFDVIAHGDLWTTNILFKYDENGKIENVKFIDYQFTRRASPLTDLIFFFWTSGNAETRGHRRNDVIKAYVETLNSTLQDLGCEENYPLEELEQDLRDTSDIALSLICQHLTLLLANPEDGPFILHEMNPIDKETGKTTETFEKLYNGKYYRRVLPVIARDFMDWVTSSNK